MEDLYQNTSNLVQEEYLKDPYRPGKMEMQGESGDKQYQGQRQCYLSKL